MIESGEKCPHCDPCERQQHGTCDKTAQPFRPSRVLIQPFVSGYRGSGGTDCSLDGFAASLRWNTAVCSLVCASARLLQRFMKRGARALAIARPGGGTFLLTEFGHVKSGDGLKKYLGFLKQSSSNLASVWAGFAALGRGQRELSMHAVPPPQHPAGKPDPMSVRS